VATDRIPQRFEPFVWDNPAVKIKLVEDEGLAIVYVDGKVKAGAYCKVFIRTQTYTKFLKDGYADIQGKFKYIAFNMKNVEEFKILFDTEVGSVTRVARKPNMVGKI
jgi:hypothetical protein